ncbi:MAG: anaerobic glycerol-3-phosphate dehydrogenase subunit A, partial [Bacteroidales bacterium]|nr:anaerobic glycerol-3-phosphate dehydrogenase subunit A [Bacteroidales bacterium]
YDKVAKENKEYRARIVVNAAGVWGQTIAAMAGCQITMFPAKGSLLIFGHRVNNILINRCRKPANADILVPGDSISLIGTTSTRVPLEECDDMKVTPEEVDILLTEGAKLAPVLAKTRVLRAYAGVRPLVASDDDPTGRNISRGIVLLDHSTRDNVEGFITITGGKLMTYRLMAEWTADLVCKKLGNAKACITATTPLPGSEKKEAIREKKSFAVKALTGRMGTRSENVKVDDEFSRALVCECEGVSVGEIEYALDNFQIDNLVDLRRRTRTGMGTCQGELCSCRAAGLVAKARGCAEKSKEDLRSFLEERYKGMYPTAWGDTLRECQFIQKVYKDICGL